LLPRPIGVAQERKLRKVSADVRVRVPGGLNYHRFEPVAPFGRSVPGKIRDSGDFVQIEIER